MEDSNKNRPNKPFSSNFRARLASAEALPQLAALGLAAGLVTGLVILGFRALIEVPLTHLLPGQDSENFQGLSRHWHFLLPLGGAFLVGLILQQLRPSERRVGVVHVLERLSLHQGRLPGRNAVIQFITGVLALITGQSGGREGPAIHLGAATSSLIGQWLRLPNNSLRTLVACGVAAAIAASFNTPMAGVIFAMEVVMMEYRMRSFIPVIIAAVTATLLTQLVYGPDAAFAVPQFTLGSLSEIPMVAAAGVLIGALAALFISLVRICASQHQRPVWLRMLIAGLVTGCAALVTPAVLGIGYDSVNAAMLNQMAISALFALAAMKLIASAVSIGLGMPVGLIGPTLVIGAAFGGLVGELASRVFDTHADAGFYVMLGMAAMMAATLQAPLAALVAVLELTGNPNIILPAMLIIVIATLVTSDLFRQRSIYLSALAAAGLEYPPNAVTRELQNAGVTSVMNTDLITLPPSVDLQTAQWALERQPQWLLIKIDNAARSALLPQDLQLFLDEHIMPDTSRHQEAIDLERLPGARLDLAAIAAEATLHEALQLLETTGIEALCVCDTGPGQVIRHLGLITRSDIDNYLRSTH